MSVHPGVPVVKGVRGAALTTVVALALSGCTGTEINNNCSEKAQCTGKGYNHSEAGGDRPEAHPSSTAAGTQSTSPASENPNKRHWTLRLRNSECGNESATDVPTASSDDAMGDVDPDEVELGHDQTGSCSGAYGIASYYTENGLKKMRGYVHDTVGDDHCAMLWIDFTTSPENHDNAQAYLACGKGHQAWGVTRSSTDASINGIRAAVCITGVHGCYDQNGNSVEWPYHSWDADTCWWYRIDTKANGKCGEGNRVG